MGAKTGIGWTNSTWNVLRGCTRISEGCRFCYAEGVAARSNKPGQPFEGLAHKVGGEPRWTGELMFVDHLLDQPLRWRAPRKIFVNSVSDLFHEKVAVQWIDKIVAVMALADHHTFQVLTKRADRMRDYLNDPETPLRVASQVNALAVKFNLKKPRFNPAGVAEGLLKGWRWPLLNVWWGVSVEDQHAADLRLPILRATRGAAIRWISAEPLIGALDLNRYLLPGNPLTGHFNCGGQYIMDGNIHWVVVGGESGISDNVRPMHPAWVRDILLQCRAYKVPFFFKQWGEYSPDKPAGYCLLTKKRYSHDSVTFRPDGTRYNAKEPDGWSEPGMTFMYRGGKHNTGNALDGEVYEEYPGQ